MHNYKKKNVQLVKRKFNSSKESLIELSKFAKMLGILFETLALI